jgi:hypothetical protein
MKEETPKDITPMKRKGIEMSVKGLHKKFPFVIGYRDDITEQYSSAHYIDLIINLDKLSEYMDVPVRPYWKEVIKNNPSGEMVYAMYAFLNFEDDYRDLKDNPGYVLQEEMRDTLNGIYSFLPDEYKMFYESNSGWITPTPIYQVTLKINGYLMK